MDPSIEYLFNKNCKIWNLSDFTSYVLSKDTTIQNVGALLHKLSQSLKYFISAESVSPKAKEQANKLLQNWNVTKNQIKEAFENIKSTSTSSTSSTSAKKNEYNKQCDQFFAPVDKVNKTVNYNNNTYNTDTLNQTIVNDVASNEQINEKVKGKRKFTDNSNTTYSKSVKINKNKQSFEIHPPSTNHTSPNKPRIIENDSEILANAVNVILQDNDLCDDLSINDIYNLHQKEQDTNHYLNQLPCSFQFLKDVIIQDIDHFIDFIWSYKLNDEISKLDQQMLDMMKYILTDFHINCKLPQSPYSSNERTPFCQLLVPIFKVFSAITNLISFTWCEKGMYSNKLLSFCVPEQKKDQFLIDGIGTSVTDKKERLLFESSGIDNHNHICDDTIKQINNTINCLKLDLMYYRKASMNTIKKRKTFGIQFINEKMTLSETFLTSEKKWAFILVRTAVIPSRFSNIKQFIKVFELLSKLLFLLNEQEYVTRKLEDEILGLDPVDENEMVKKVLDNIV